MRTHLAANKSVKRFLFDYAINEVSSKFIEFCFFLVFGSVVVLNRKAKKMD